MLDYFVVYERMFDGEVVEEVSMTLQAQNLEELQKVLDKMQSEVYENELGLEYLISNCQVFCLN